MYGLNVDRFPEADRVWNAPERRDATEVSWTVEEITVPLGADELYVGCTVHARALVCAVDGVHRFELRDDYSQEWIEIDYEAATTGDLGPIARQIANALPR